MQLSSRILKANLWAVGPAVRDKPSAWLEVLAQTLDEKGMTQEDLAFEARRLGGLKINSSWISKIRNGHRPLSIEFLESLAGALGVPPETFAEYRLAIARVQLDESEVGLEAALANLRELEAAASAEELLPLREGGLLAQSVAAHRSTPESQSAKPKRSANRRRRGRAARKAA